MHNTYARNSERARVQHNVDDRFRMCFSVRMPILVRVRAHVCLTQCFRFCTFKPKWFLLLFLIFTNLVESSNVQILKKRIRWRRQQKSAHPSMDLKRFRFLPLRVFLFFSMIIQIETFLVFLQLKTQMAEISIKPIGFRNGHFQSARCRFLTRWKKRWKWILSEWTFERKTTIAALQYGSHLCLCCSWRLLKPNFAINAQLAHMCSIDTLCIQAIVLCSAINFHSIDKMIVCVWFCNYNFECTHAQWMLIERPRDWKSQSIHSTKSNWIDERMNERSLLHRETWNTHRERERLTGVFALEKKSISLFLMRQFLAY